jgi:hypothetical protein
MPPSTKGQVVPPQKGVITTKEQILLKSFILKTTLFI